MARFDPYLPENTEQVPEWFRYIRGFDKNIAERGSQVGRAVGDLGQTAQTVGQTYGEVNNIQIENRAYDLIDPIRNKFGVEEATRLAQQGKPPTNMKGDSTSLINAFDPQGAPTVGAGSTTSTGQTTQGAPASEGASQVTDFSSVSKKQAPSQGQGIFSPNPQTSARNIQGAPAGAQRLGQRVQDLQKAYDAGEASPSYYFANLNAAVSQLRSEFPQFKAEIDRHVQQITGVNPANALRSQLLHDMDIAERQKAAQGNAMWNFMKNPDNMGIIERVYPGIYQDPSRYPGVGERELINTVAQYRAKRGEHTDLIQGIEDYRKTQDERTNSAFDLLGARSSQHGADSVKGVLGAASNGDVDKWLQGEIARTGGRPKATDIQQYAQMSNQLKQKLEVEWAGLLKEKTNPDDPNSPVLGSLVSRNPGKLKEMHDTFIAQHSGFLDAMYNQHYGLVQANQRWVQGHQENVARTVAERYPNLAAVKVLNENLGNDWKNGVDKEVTQQILGDGLNAVRLGHLAESVEPNHNDNWGPPSLQRYLNDTKRDNRDKLPAEEFGVAEMNDHVRHLISEDTPLESRKRLATAMFTNDMTFPKGYINMYRPEMWSQVLSTMAGPKVSAAIKSIGDEKLTNDYVAWTKRNAAAALRADIFTIQSQLEARGDIQVHFQTLPGHGGEFYVEKKGPQPASEFQEPPPLQAEITHVNQILRTIEPALNLTGNGISDEVAAFAKKAGIDESKAGTAKPEPTGKLLKEKIGDFGRMINSWLSNPYYKLKTNAPAPTGAPVINLNDTKGATEGREDIK